MKKKNNFGWTIFEKSFTLLLVSFLLVNCLNVFLDYKFAKEDVIDALSSRKITPAFIELNKTFSQKYHSIYNEGFLETINTFLEDTNYQYEYDWEILILDDQYNLVHTNEHPLYIDFMVYVSEDSQRSCNLTFDQNNQIDNEKISRLEKKLETFLEDSEHPIMVHYQVEEDEVVYLSICGEELIENEKYKGNYRESRLDVFESENIKYSTYISPYYISLRKIRENVLTEIKNQQTDYENSIKDFNYRAIYGYEDTFEKEGDMYSYTIFPLLKSNISFDEDEFYNINNFQGYIVVRSCAVDYGSMLLHTVLSHKGIVFFTSFVFVLLICFALASTLSKRIKEIEKGTKRIAQNDFNIQLKETPNDELGMLSQSINQMSQQLKETIFHLNKEIDKVKKLESIKQEFITNFTHEIKTPLGIIDGYIELIETTDNENKKEQYLKTIEQEVSRINELVMAMLNLSRLESGKVELKIEEIDLDDVVISTIDAFISLIQKKDIHVIVNGTTDTIQADLFEFQIVIKNFLSNAIKHTPKQGNIYITYDDESFSIENEGSFLTEQQMESIWDTYVSSDREGTGLGLAICKSILELHHFSYEVQNTERGVCFTIRFKESH
jgi:Signal transduction histidine kinase